MFRLSATAAMADLHTMLGLTLPPPNMETREGLHSRSVPEHGCHPGSVQSWSTCTQEVLQHVASLPRSKQRFPRGSRHSSLQERPLGPPADSCSDWI